MTKPDFVAHTPPKNDPTRWHDLKEHLSDVAVGAAGLAKKLGAEKLGHYAGLWHDLGKYNPEFQKYLKLCAEGNPHAKSVPHAVHGAILAAEIMPPIAPLIYGHHGGLPQIQEMMGKRICDPAHQLLYQAALQQAEAWLTDTNKK
jgi:CRISPR-associated endonuclease/helicase Cas3